MNRIVFALLVGLPGLAAASNPDPKSLAVPPEIAARANDLVGSLASREYAERVAATAELKKLGRFALPALKEALAVNSNAEVRLRIELILPSVAADDLKARVECFLADADNKFQHDLPGAKQYFDAVGRTDSAKALFRDLFRSANRDMLVSLGDAEADLKAKYTARRQVLGLMTNTVAGKKSATPTALDAAALLLVEAYLPDRAPTGTTVAARQTSVLTNTVVQNILRPALSDDREPAVGAILRKWGETREQPLVIYNALSYFTREGLPHGLTAARKFVTGEIKGGSVLYRGNAFVYLGRFGGAEDLAALESQFENKGAASTTTIVGPGGPGGAKRQVIQYRDLALAMALLNTKQDPAAYGLTYRYANVKTAIDTQKFNYTAHYFDADTEAKADEKREAALKKYAEWKADQKKQQEKEPGLLRD